MAKAQLQKYDLILKSPTTYAKEHLADGNTLSKELPKSHSL